MPAVRASRTIAAPAEELWRVVSDPHHLPRWWPRVKRVEGVAPDAFTEVMVSGRGKVVRADFNVVEADETAGRVRWEQRIEGTPFASVLRSSIIEIELDSPRAGGALATQVTIELRQEVSGGGRDGRLFGLVRVPRVAGMMVGKAAAATIDEALDGLERISG